jgi:hypothetical protein
MAVMAWRRERVEFFSTDALIVFLLPKAISPTAAIGRKARSSSRVAFAEFEWLPQWLSPATIMHNN